MAKQWILADMVGWVELAEHFGTTRPAVVNWAGRYADFPARLTTVSGTPVFSKRQVVEWHGKRWPQK